jgi:hypothetical protein
MVGMGLDLMFDEMIDEWKDALFLLCGFFARFLPVVMICGCFFRVCLLALVLRSGASCVPEYLCAR